MNLQGRDLKLDLRGEDVALLHRELATIGITVPDAERGETLFGPGTHQAMVQFQRQHCLEPTGVVDAETARAINAAVGALTFTVQGKVVSRLRAGVGGLRVEVVDKNVGNDVPLAEAATDDAGSYCARFNVMDLRQRGKARPDLQACVLAGETFLGASRVCYNASNRETLDILLTERAASALPSELETLTSALSTHFEGNLRDLQETDDRQDITYLANKTGWDARAVALAALADRFSSTSADQIEAPFFYALFRAGVPANENALYQITARTAADIWDKAAAQGVIPATLKARIPHAAEQFQRLVVERSLHGPALAGVSPLKDMLTVSLGDDPARHTRFAELYAEHRTDPESLWEAVRGELGEAAEKRLRLDGQLGYLTRNNAPLIRKLHDAVGENGLTDTLSLAQQGYYRADKWLQLIGDDAIPPEVPGDRNEEKRDRYAEVLAAQVRLSFPTMVVAQMVQEGETPVALERRTEVHAFLAEHQGKFEIGMQPVQRYIARNQLQVPNEVSKEITRIQRVYQITPSDRAMNALLKSGTDSALAVSRYDREQFVRKFQSELGGAANARLTHAKAQQVHNIVLNLATSYLVARTAPQIGEHSHAKYGNTRPELIQKAQDQGMNTREYLAMHAAESPDNAADVIPYATLEALFGEMDYCACEHCRSWLSPAAYLVDLLRFLEPNDWPDTLAKWETDHKAQYPFTDHAVWVAAGQPLAVDTDLTPLEVLLSRRPDIEHLPLTCENTNTPLPYIDVVNETLEYFVSHENLGGYQGHSTDGTVTPEELLASPQSVNEASEQAYRILAGKHDGNEPEPLLPPTPPLPFHQPLENLRRYFDKFETPLPEVMEALRTSDDLERSQQPADPDNPIEYGWRDILMEELRLSRAEYAQLTEGIAPLDELLKKLYGFKPETSSLGDLSNAKAFTRRMDISYQELVDILNTRFVNPNSTLIPKVERLGVTFAGLKALHESNQTGQAWRDLLPQPVPDGEHYGSDIEKWVKDDANYTRIMSLITLSDPTPGGGDPCNFEILQFRYANPDHDANELRAFEFVRLFRFVRLWKKVGWTIEQTDKAITALYPADRLPDSLDDVENLERLNAGFLKMLPRLGVVKRVMTLLNLTPKRDLLSLLACFAPIDTHGAASLYRQLFLSPAPADDKATFLDDGFGNFLTKSEKLAPHAEALRAAFQLTYDEQNRLIRLVAGAVAELDLDTISKIYRHAWLARKLKLSVRELLLLIRITEVNPFAPPDVVDSPPAPAQPSILRFIDLVSRLRASPLKPEQALYLIWNQDISGNSAPEGGEILEFARTLRAAFAAIESEFALTDDPNGQIAQTRMALVYGTDAANFFFGLLDNTLVSEIQYDHDQPSLEQPILDAAPGRIAYDDFSKRLSFTGVMTEDARDDLLKAEGASDAFKEAVHSKDPEEKTLFAENQKIVGPFFDRYPELQPLSQLYAFFGELHTRVPYEQEDPKLAPAMIEAGQGRLTYDHALGWLSFKGVMNADIHQKILEVASPPDAPGWVENLKTQNGEKIDDFFKGFKTTYPELLIDEDTYLEANDSEPDRRTLLLERFLPELKRRRKRQQALSVVSAAASTQLVLASAVLDDNLVLNPAGAPADAAPESLPPAMDDLTAMEVVGLAFSETTGAWSGYVEAPENGLFNFSVEPVLAGGSGAITVNGTDHALEKEGEALSNTTAIELRAGALYPVRFQAEISPAGLRVRWQTQGRGWEVIPPQYLYSATLIDHLRATYVRFLKAAAIAAGLKLAAAELAYFAALAEYRIGERGWLNRLPVAGSPDGATSTALLKAFEALLDFAGLKARFAPNDQRLLAVLKDPNALVETPAGTPETDKESLLLTLTRWEGTSLDSLLLRFGLADRTALTDLRTFVRASRAYDPVKKIGVSASALIQATTNEPQAPAVRAFKSALRARYEESDWLNVLRPINDELRSLQRDALVAYILHQMGADPKSEHIDTPEKLFEYFLMDVQMDPCMQTSRIRHALSSVQLFIGRCLMNLETGVAPPVFKPEHRNQWEWMKRYRVWEANRKVFLWPEHWVEPELRGDQSPFFKEAMSELLQSDITEDRAATALLNYLSKLEEVAKLEPCGIHFVEGDTATSDGISHVVAALPEATASTTTGARNPACGRHGKRSSSTSRTTRSFRWCGTIGCSFSG